MESRLAGQGEPLPIEIPQPDSLPGLAALPKEPRTQPKHAASHNHALSSVNLNSSANHH